MAISSVLVGSLHQGGGLDWHAEVFPRRLLKWNGQSTEELFTVPGDKPFIAFATVHVFSGGHPEHLLDMETGEEVYYGAAARTSCAAPDTGMHYTGLIGLSSEVTNRSLRARPLPGYGAPDWSYQISIWWAELPDDLGGTIDH